MPRPITILRKKAKSGDRDFPKATLAFYGPDNKRATKAVLGIVYGEEDEPNVIRYYNDEKDIRVDIDTQLAILARLKELNVQTFVMLEKIFGCPHEEGKDYPEGEPCPMCPFWKDRDRYEAFD